jgi:hypothetical protein
MENGGYPRRNINKQASYDRIEYRGGGTMKIKHSMISATVIAVSLIAFNLVSCSGGGGGGGGAADIEVSLSTAGSVTTVAAGGTVTIRAQVNNATDMNVAWSLSGTNCPNDCGTITQVATDFAEYKAPMYPPAQFAVTVTAASVENPARSASLVITVQARSCAASASLLNGQYAFLLQGFSNNAGSGAGIATVGSFTADGCGSITGGSADYYFGPTLAGNTASLSGTYTIGADHRGTLSLIVNSATKTFFIALGKISNNVATRGGMTETGPSNLPTILSGSMWKQDTAAFSQNQITGPYAFVFNGWNATTSYGPREAMGGTVTADGAGNFTTGLVDDKAYGAAAVTDKNWTGTYGAPSVNGRSVLIATTLTGTNGTGVIYVVNSGQLIVMISDTSSTGRVFSGSMLGQTGPFSQASLNGNIVTYQTANYWASGAETLTTSVLSLFSADSGTLVFPSYDQNDGGAINHGSMTPFTYTVAANGHATIYTTTTPTTNGGKWYLTGLNTGLMLGFDTGGSVGEIMSQATGTFTTASISGDYFASQAPGGSIQSPYSSGTAKSSGNGMLSTTMDVYGLTPGQQASGTLTADPLINGRFTDTNYNIIYMVSPSKFLMLNESPGNYVSVIQIFEK